jgi:hypothetical protein
MPQNADANLRTCPNSRAAPLNSRRLATQTIAVAAGGYAILVHALVACAAQS